MAESGELDYCLKCCRELDDDEPCPCDCEPDGFRYAKFVDDEEWDEDVEEL